MSSVMLALVILFILLTWLVCAAVCVGIGSLILCWFRFAFTAMEAFWTGIAGVVGILQLYHFFRPIESQVVFFLVVLGVAGLLWNRAALFQMSGSLTTRLLNTFLLSIPAALIAFRSAAPCEHYDTGLYGAQAIRWFTTYPVVPGLANLIGQFGFNSSVFLCLAALERGPWRGFAHHLFVGFLVAALFAAIIPAAMRVLRGPVASASDWFLTLLFIPAAITALMARLSGANTDVPTTVVCLAAAYMLFRAFDGAGPSSQLSLFVAMLLLSLAVTFKLSSLVFAFSAWLIAFLALWWLGRSAHQRNQILIGAVALSSFLIFPWLARGLVLSGYPLFPATALSIPADWKAPTAAAQLEFTFAQSFARIPQIPLADTSGVRWIKPWFRELIREREGFLIPMAFALAGVIVAFWRKSRGRPRWLWLLVPSFCGLLFWLIGAPAIRFGEPVFWIAGGTLGTFAAIHLLDTSVKIRFAFVGLLLLVAWSAHPRLLWGSYMRPSLSVRTLLPLPETKLDLVHTSSGLAVYMPFESNKCWDAPLPCTFTLKDTLRARQPGELKRGFASSSPYVVRLSALKP